MRFFKKIFMVCYIAIDYFLEWPFELFVGISVMKKLIFNLPNLQEI